MNAWTSAHCSASQETGLAIGGRARNRGDEAGKVYFADSSGVVVGDIHRAVSADAHTKVYVS